VCLSPRARVFLEGIAADPNVRVISRSAEWLADKAQIIGKPTVPGLIASRSTKRSFF